MLLTTVLTAGFTWSAIHAALAGVSIAVTVLGGLFWYLMRRIDATRHTVDDVDDDVKGLAAKVETLWNFCFGRENDATDKGLAGDVEEGFESVSDDVNRLERKMDAYREEEKAEFRNLVNALHESSEVDIERDDIYTDND